MIASSWKCSKRKDGVYPRSCAPVRRRNRPELGGLKWLFPGANMNPFQKALRQPGVIDNVTKGQLLPACLCCVPPGGFSRYAAPGLEAEVSKAVPLAKKLTRTHAWISHPGWRVPSSTDQGPWSGCSDSGLRVRSSTERDSLASIPSGCCGQ